MGEQTTNIFKFLIQESSRSLQVLEDDFQALEEIFSRQVVVNEGPNYEIHEVYAS